MTATLVVTPNPVPSGGTSVDGTGAGFDTRPTRVLLDGAEIVPSRIPVNGGFTFTFTASTTETSQNLVAEQCVAGSWLQKATLTVPILDSPPVDTPFADMTGWRLVFADEFDRTIAEGHFVDGGNYSPPGVWGILTADHRYVVYKDGTFDTAHVGKWDPSIISVDGSKMRIHLHTRDGYPRVAAMIVQPSGGTAKGGLLGLRYHIKVRADLLSGYAGVPLLWPDSGNWPHDGEIDFPESQLTLPPHGFMHRQDATSTSDQYAVIPSPDRSWDDWHDYVVEWIAGTSFKAFIDGVQVGTTQTSRVPSTLMHLVLQFETAYGAVPSALTDGYVEIDRVGVWAYAP